MSEKTTEVNAQFLFYKKGGGAILKEPVENILKILLLSTIPLPNPTPTTHMLTHSKRKVYKQ